MSSIQSDIKPVMRGAQKVVEAISHQQREQWSRFWHNSSLKSGLYNIESALSSRFTSNKQQNVDSDSNNILSQKADVDVASDVSSLNDAANIYSQQKYDNNIAYTQSRYDSCDTEQNSLVTNQSQEKLLEEKSVKHENVAEKYSPVADITDNNAPKLNHENKIKSLPFYLEKPPVSTVHLEHSYQLSEFSKQRKVPSSRASRFASFGGLAAGLGFGALAEVTKRGIGISKNNNSSNSLIGNSAFLSESNIERIVNTLCRVRGAALKLGQMLSIQDSSLIDPRLQAIFERVRQSADFMPNWQMERAMRAELGKDWRSKFVTFEDQPFAAASIGQVHKAVLPDGRVVAIKIQYPGVAQSIESDINNLMSILKFWNVLPEGLHIDATARVAKRELAWECDYIREAEYAGRFRSEFSNDSVFYVPEVIKSLTTKRVLAMEFVEGVTVDKLRSADEQTRNWVCQNILRLCLHELFIINFMQTDPNWSNFLYDTNNQRIILLDFGASREYDLKFVKPYLRLIKAAAQGNRAEVVEYSRLLGFLTGYENKVMEKAHVDAVLILGEPFATNEPFNFEKQSTAARIHELIGVMLKHRLTPPPEEVYSLHRKMAGCFLLCTKLKSSVSCKPLFDEVYEKFMQIHYSHSEAKTLTS